MNDEKRPEIVEVSDQDDQITQINVLAGLQPAPDKHLLPIIIRDPQIFAQRMGIEHTDFVVLQKFGSGRDLLVAVANIKSSQRIWWRQWWDYLARRRGFGGNIDSWFALLETAAQAGIGYDLTTAKYLQRAQRGELSTLPRCLQTPFDVLGLALSDILLPPAIKVAQCDEDFAPSERGTIIHYFVEVWGMDAEFVSFKINEIETETHQFSYLSLRDALKSQCKRFHLPYKAFAQEILHILDQVIRADGVLDRREIREFTTFKAMLLA